MQWAVSAVVVNLYMEVFEDQAHGYVMKASSQEFGNVTLPTYLLILTGQMQANAASHQQPTALHPFYHFYHNKHLVCAKDSVPPKQTRRVM